MAESFVTVGKITGPFGIKGGLLLHSYTDPQENIFNYHPWYLQKSHGPELVEYADARPHGKGFVIQLVGITDRNQAEALGKPEIVITRDKLPALPPGQHYWDTLIGLTVTNTHGELLGKVAYLFETPGNDVLVVQGGNKEHLIPYIQPQFIISVDIEAQAMVVDWDSDF